MSKLRAHNIVVSLDGYATGDGQDVRLWDELEGLHERYSVETVTVPSGATHVLLTR
jgi:hypothetical protein